MFKHIFWFIVVAFCWFTIMSYLQLIEQDTYDIKQVMIMSSPGYIRSNPNQITISGTSIPACPAGQNIYISNKGSFTCVNPPTFNE